MQCKSGLEQRVELAGALQGVEVIAATDMGTADPDLRHRSPAGLLAHLGAYLRLAVDLDFLEGHALALEQVLGTHAVGAVVAGVDDDVVHITSPGAGYRLSSWKRHRSAWRRYNQP